MSTAFDGLIDAIADATARRVLAELRANPGLPPARALSVAQAASYLGRDQQAVRKLIREGKLPAVRMDGRVQIDRGDLDTLIERAKG